MILGRKLTKLRLISSEDFFFREHHNFETKIDLRPRISDNFIALSGEYCMTGIGIPIAVPASEVMVVPTGRKSHPSKKYGRIQNFSGSDKKLFGKNQKFLGSERKYFGQN